MNYRLPKSERLHSEKLIKELFSEGSSFFLYPFKVIFLKSEKLEQEATAVLFSVPKKKIKKAHDRNLVKRRMKEAYRLNKHSLTVAAPIFLGLVYVSHELMEFSQLQSKITKVLHRLNEEYLITYSNEQKKK
ncbi:ribonuclease P protein component [Algoriphagus namhaensis]